MECKCVYESDCHGIEMIRTPSGIEIAIGGTNTEDRFQFCPYCGGYILRKKFSSEYLKGFLSGQRHERRQKIMFTPIQEIYNKYKDTIMMNEVEKKPSIFGCWNEIWLAIKQYCEVTK